VSTDKHGTTTKNQAGERLEEGREGGKWERLECGGRRTQGRHACPTKVELTALRPLSDDDDDNVMRTSLSMVLSEQLQIDRPDEIDNRKSEEWSAVPSPYPQKRAVDSLRPRVREPWPESALRRADFSV